jgi:hypothetical protein
MHEDTFWSFDGEQGPALIPCFKFVISPQTDLERIWRRKAWSRCHAVLERLYFAASYD